MPARIASGSFGQASSRKAKPESTGAVCGTNAPDSAPLALESAVLAGVSSIVRIPSSPLCPFAPTSPVSHGLAETSKADQKQSKQQSNDNLQPAVAGARAPAAAQIAP